MEKKCGVCGSSRVEAAQLESAALRPVRTSTMKKVFSVGGVLECDVCLDCGAVSHLRTDPAQLAAMLS